MKAIGMVLAGGSNNRMGELSKKAGRGSNAGGWRLQKY